MSILGSLANSARKIGEQAIKSATAGLDRMANRQEFEAVIAATVLVACADETISREEKETAMRSATAHPALKSFSSTDVMDEFTTNQTLLGADRALGIESMLGKVRKVTDLAARARLIGVAMEIASADGTVDAKELAMIERMRSGV